jgi:hypothetical protein
MTDKEIVKELQDGITRLTEWLDYIWNCIKDSKCREAAMIVEGEYNAALRTIIMLGGGWKRDENGKHHVSIAGVTGNNA